ncbi:copper-transporting ATPase [Streptomyces sp. NPDC052701]|uniref:copper-transporting ATPase n=1 Tax=Streptomyces sp. NPDC052701 TaxID=3155533 RepID=UPI003445441B
MTEPREAPMPVTAHAVSGVSCGHRRTRPAQAPGGPGGAVPADAGPGAGRVAVTRVGEPDGTLAAGTVDAAGHGPTGRI